VHLIKNALVIEIPERRHHIEGHKIIEGSIVFGEIRGDRTFRRVVLRDGRFLR